jgi:hypothetical protein
MAQKGTGNERKNGKASFSKSSGSGRTLKHPILELKLLDWVKHERVNEKRVVSYRRLREKAKEISKELDKSTFVGSDKWISGFMKSHG